MADQEPDYEQLKQLFIDEQRQRLEQRLEDEQRQRQEVERRLEIAEAATRKTVFDRFLDACHVQLHLKLVVQTSSQSTQGNPANAQNKPRPQRLRAWTGFASQQEKIWEALMSSDFATKQLFDSVYGLSVMRRRIQERKISSETDLHTFQRWVVDDPVSDIIKEIYNDSSLRKKFRIKGTVTFENHANTLSLEEAISDTPIRLQAKSLQAESSESRPSHLQAESSSSAPLNPTHTAQNNTSRPSRAQANQFCVYNAGDNIRVVAFVVEYKAPHKIPLGFIYEGLDDMDLDNVVPYRKNEVPQDHFRRLIAAVITQAYSYMIQTGVQYGCVCTGEATIFLHVL